MMSWRNRFGAIAVVSLLMAQPLSAESQVTDGRTLVGPQLVGFDYTRFNYEPETGLDFESTRSRFGVSPMLGLAVARGLGARTLLGLDGQVLWSSESVDDAGTASRVNVRLLPFFDVLLGHPDTSPRGARPFIGAGIGLTINSTSFDDGTDTTAKLGVFGARLGLRGFVMKSLSIDPVLFLGGMTGSADSDDFSTDIKGMLVTLSLGMSAWFGDREASAPREMMTPVTRSRRPARVARAPRAAAPAPSRSKYDVDVLLDGGNRTLRLVGNADHPSGRLTLVLRRTTTGAQKWRSCRIVLAHDELSHPLDSKHSATRPRWNAELRRYEQTEQLVASVESGTMQAWLEHEGSTLSSCGDPQFRPTGQARQRLVDAVAQFVQMRPESGHGSAPAAEDETQAVPTEADHDHPASPAPAAAASEADPEAETAPSTPDEERSATEREPSAKPAGQKESETLPPVAVPVGN